MNQLIMIFFLFFNITMGIGYVTQLSGTVLSTAELTYMVAHIFAAGVVTGCLITEAVITKALGEK